MASKVIKTTPDVLPGDMATFALDSDVIGPYRYMWKKDGVFIGGAGSNKTYTTGPLTQADFRSVFSCTIYGQDLVEEAEGLALNPEMPDPATFSNTEPKGKS